MARKKKTKVKEQPCGGLLVGQGYCEEQSIDESYILGSFIKNAKQIENSDSLKDEDEDAKDSDEVKENER